jgi:hypothetical protein
LPEKVRFRFGAAMSFFGLPFLFGKQVAQDGQDFGEGIFGNVGAEVEERADHSVADVMPQVEQRHQHFVQRRRLARAAVIIQVRTFPIRALGQSLGASSLQFRQDAEENLRQNRRMEAKQGLDLMCAETVKVLEPIEF